MAKDHAQKTPPKQTARKASKKLSETIGHFSSIACACGVMVWSTFNIWVNILEYRKTQAEVAADKVGDWNTAFILVFVTAAIPLLFGLALLIKATGKKNKRER